jgi:hypothetical protein
MDLNEYTTTALLRERHAEMVEAARRAALLRGVETGPHPLRTALGTALIRLGAWLLREQYPAPAAR